MLPLVVVGILKLVLLNFSIPMKQTSMLLQIAHSEIVCAFWRDAQGKRRDQIFLHVCDLPLVDQQEEPLN